jgi:MFS family permease
MGVVWDRLGFPVIGRHRRFVVAIVVDALGSGVFLPVSILYFLATTDLSLVRIGLALSIASAVQLPFGPLAGGLVDRFGAKQILLVANALEAVGFLGYVFADSFGAVLVTSILVRLGQTGFWSSFSPVVATISLPGERERWFGFLGALRNASFALGGIAAAVAITIGTTTAYTLIVLVNAASYVLAFGLLWSVPGQREPIPDVADDAPTGWGHVLRDRPYLLMVATNLSYATSAMALNVAIPVYLSQTLALPGWVVGVAFSLNTVLIGLGQGLVVNAMVGSVRADIVALGCLLSAVSYAVFLSATWLSVSVGVVVALVATVVFTGGEMTAGPVLSALSTDGAEPHLRGRYVSLHQMSWTVAMTVAPVTMTWLLEVGSAVLWGALAAVSVGGCLLARLLTHVMPEAGKRVVGRASLPEPAEPLTTPTLAPGG